MSRSVRSFGQSSTKAVKRKFTPVPPLHDGRCAITRIGRLCRHPALRWPWCYWLYYYYYTARTGSACHAMRPGLTGFVCGACPIWTLRPLPAAGFSSRLKGMGEGRHVVVQAPHQFMIMLTALVGVALCRMRRPACGYAWRSPLANGKFTCGRRFQPVRTQRDMHGAHAFAAMMTGHFAPAGWLGCCAAAGRPLLYCALSSRPSAFVRRSHCWAVCSTVSSIRCGSSARSAWNIVIGGASRQFRGAGRCGSS